MAASKKIAEIAAKFGLTYFETRAILKKHGVVMRRGRKCGSGVGQRVDGGKRVDRRTKWQIERMQEGKCTSCGELNDSDSLYHCKACLKHRNEQIKERNKNKKK